MKTKIIDNSGRLVWEDPKEKLEYVVSKISPIMQTINNKIVENESKYYPRKLNFNTKITTYLLNILSEYENVPYNYAILIDLQTLIEYSKYFRKLVSFIVNYYDDYICTKEQFCAFLGISYSSYNELLVSNKGDILAEMERLEGFFGELQFAAGQSGVYKEKTTENKLKAVGLGHSVDMRPNISSITINNTMKLDNDGVNKKLQQILGNNFNKK